MWAYTVNKTLLCPSYSSTGKREGDRDLYACVQCGGRGVYEVNEEILDTYWLI
jgi:hypothetical protein